MSDAVLIAGDCRRFVPSLPEESFDSCVTDPPYSLVSIQKRFGKPGSAPAQYGRDGAYARTSAGFMGAQWDTGEVAHDPAFWAEVLRVLKPGGHVAAMGGTRTYHRLACAIEDAGFELRDMVAFMYASGFPKRPGLLKPAFEPIVIARKPGPGGLNTEACRIGTESTIRVNHAGTAGPGWRFGKKEHVNGSEAGRWPANLAHDGSDEVLETIGPDVCRFFYSAKAGPEDRLGSRHPTVKPVALIRWLMRLVMPVKLCCVKCGYVEDHPRRTAVQPVRRNIQTERRSEPVLLDAMSSQGGKETADGLSALQSGISPTLQRREAAEILLEGVRERGGDQTGQAPLRELRADIPADQGRQAAVLLDSLRDEMVRPETPETASRPEGLRIDQVSRASDGKQSRIRHGTPPRNGGGARSKSVGVGSSAPQERDQERQSDREPGADGQTSTRRPAQSAPGQPAMPVLRSGAQNVECCPRCGGSLAWKATGTILDPFAGSGTSATAALAEGFDAILIEREEAYIADIKNRLAYHRGDAMHSGQLKAQRREGARA